MRIQRIYFTACRDISRAQFHLLQNFDCLNPSPPKAAMGKLNTIIEKIIKGSALLLSQILEQTLKGTRKNNTSRGLESSSTNNLDIHKIVEYCRDEIQASEDSGIMPSPKYFEQAAILSRKEKKYDNEIAICEMYIELTNHYAIINNLTDAEMSTQLLPICAPLMKRLHNAKIISATS